jgi:tRNA G37 N-methylase Trm5
MAELVVHTAQIEEIRQRHLVLSSSNETQHQPHPSQVTIKNASEQIHRELLALELIPHLWTILPIRAVI